MPVVDFLKTIDMKVVVDLASEAWDEISPVTLRKSWQKILPLPPPVPTDLDEHSRGDNESSEPLIDGSEDSDFTCMFDTLGIQVDSADISAWLHSDNADPGFQLYTDDEICELGMEKESVEGEEEVEEEADETCPVSNAAAAHMF